MDKENYKKYVKLDCWALRRSAYLKKHAWCEGCGQRVPLQVHHLTYERLGRELDEDLFAVCEPCHKTFHRLPGATPITWVLQYISNMPVRKKLDLAIEWLRAA
jgi:5-methylcytosine-specific restriction endonuclease McrA